MDSVVILGVRINKIKLEEARQKVRVFLNSPGQYKIFTPNPEFLVKASNDEYFKYTLNTSDLSLCDGRGIQFVSKVKLDRIPGVDFMLEICRIAEEENKSVYLLGSGSDEVVKKTAENLQQKFPRLKVVGFNKGLQIYENSNITIQQYNTEPKIIVDQSENDRILNEINKIRPDILFVAFGMGKQEKWIVENLAKMRSVKIAMGVGGAFDYISGNVKRAPLLMRKVGLEWLYRLIKQPVRIIRIWNAIIVFPWLVLKDKLKSIKLKISL